MGKRLLLLDLDGTIRRTKSGERFINNPYDQEILPTVKDRLGYYTKHNWQIAGITNQGGVAAGKKLLPNVIIEQNYTMQLAGGAISSIYFCPDYKGNICYRCVYIQPSDFVIEMIDLEVVSAMSNLTDPSREPIVKHGFRKPEPGMIELALYGYGFDRSYDIALMVGDRKEDETAAAKAHIEFMWAEEWRNRKT